MGNKCSDTAGSRMGRFLKHEWSQFRKVDVIGMFPSHLQLACRSREKDKPVAGKK